MDFFTIIKKRRSIRRFKQKEVPDKTINKILKAASLAPSGLNQQPWDFIVVKNPALKKEIRNVYDDSRKKLGLYEQDTSFVENACQIFVCGNKTKITPIISCSLAIENMLLAATALGLGSIVTTSIIGVRENFKKLKKLLKIPNKYIIVALVLIGFSDETPKAKPRRKLKEIKHVDGF